MIPLRNPSVSNYQSLLYSCAWLFHPFSINVSTRGNAESLVAILVLLSLYPISAPFRKYSLTFCRYLIFTDNITLGAFFYGLSVHFKIYPIIYSIALYFFIDHIRPTPRNNQPRIGKLFTRNRLVFFFVSASTFLILTSWMYYLYGYKFLFETYLYHVSRTDPRHNFSVYFYQLYLHTSQVSYIINLFSCIFDGA